MTVQFGEAPDVYKLYKVIQCSVLLRPVNLLGPHGYHYPSDQLLHCKKSFNSTYYVIHYKVFHLVHRQTSPETLIIEPELTI